MPLLIRPGFAAAAVNVTRVAVGFLLTLHFLFGRQLPTAESGLFVCAQTLKSTSLKCFLSSLSSPRVRSRSKVRVGFIIPDRENCATVDRGNKTIDRKKKIFQKLQSATKRYELSRLCCSMRREFRLTVVVNEKIQLCF